MSAKKPKKPWVRHCTGCRHMSGPVRTDPDSDQSCCTCCRDSDGNHGHGRNDGGGW